MAGVRDHTELAVWQLADQLERETESLLERPCFRRDPDLLDQLRRAVSSAPTNIAEGFSRFYPKDNAKFVRIARGSLAECLIHIERARRRTFISAEECATLTRLGRRAHKAAARYVVYLEAAQYPKPPSERRVAPPRKPEPEP